MTDHLKVIFDNEGWILDIYDTKGQNPLPFFDRVSVAIIVLSFWSLIPRPKPRLIGLFTLMHIQE